MNQISYFYCEHFSGLSCIQNVAQPPPLAPKRFLHFKRKLYPLSSYSQPQATANFHNLYEFTYLDIS